MRLWLVAAKLGLGLAKKKISSGGFWPSVRRSSTFTDVERSIYLCFNELSPLGYNRDSDCVEDYANHVVRRIRLNHDGDGDVDVEEELSVEAYKTSTFCERYPTSCTTLGSKIIIPLYSNGNFKDICWTDTSKRPVKFQVSSPTDIEIRSFTAPKHEMKLREIDGKLYCLDLKCKKFFNFDYYFNHFEVFDPENPVLWRPLDDPPFVVDNSSPWHDAIFLAETKKILAWQVTLGIYCFDVTKPKNGWIEVTDPYMEVTLPFFNKPFFVHNHHPDIGDFYLVFLLNPYAIPPRVYAFFMSNTCDFSRSIDHFIELPELCSHYLVDDEPDDISDRKFDFEFVHLGAQKVGLVINKYVKTNPDQGKNKGLILLLTIEYDIIINNATIEDSKPNLKIESRLLGTRNFQYQTMGLPKPKIDETDLIGAFLI